MKVLVLFAIIVAVALAKPSGLAGYEYIGYSGYPAPYNYHSQQPLLLSSNKGWDSFAPTSFGYETKLKTDLELKEEPKKTETLDVKKEEIAVEDDVSEESEEEEEVKPAKETFEDSKKEKELDSEKKEEFIVKKVLVAPSYTSLPAHYATKISYASLPAAYATKLAYAPLPVAHTSKVVYSSLPVSTHSYVAPKVAYAPIASSYVPHTFSLAPAPWAPVAHSSVEGAGPWASAPVAKYEVPTYSKFAYSIHEYSPAYSYVKVKPQPVKVNAGWW